MAADALDVCITLVHTYAVCWQANAYAMMLFRCFMLLLPLLCRALLCRADAYALMRARFRL